MWVMLQNLAFVRSLVLFGHLDRDHYGSGPWAPFMSTPPKVQNWRICYNTIPAIRKVSLSSLAPFFGFFWYGQNEERAWAWLQALCGWGRSWAARFGFFYLNLLGSFSSTYWPSQKATIFIALVGGRATVQVNFLFFLAACCIVLLDHLILTRRLITSFWEGGEEISSCLLGDIG